MAHKRKYGDRRDWPRITSSDYVQKIISSDEFDGHITLYYINAVREPLHVPNCGQMVCIADAGYSWLHQIPRHGHHVVTAMFDAKGDVVQWYIDICSGTGVGKDQVPWFDDLYLDVVVLPSGEFELLDVDELQEALDSAVIDQALFNLAWEEANRVQELLASGRFDKLMHASTYRCQLLKQM
jgi:predicted RNA-binding protein associated with RNAse of E/G family